jgi:hypothetical protein
VSRAPSTTALWASQTRAAQGPSPSAKGKAKSMEASTHHGAASDVVIQVTSTWRPVPRVATRKDRHAPARYVCYGVASPETSERW